MYGGYHNQQMHQDARPYHPPPVNSDKQECQQIWKGPPHLRPFNGPDGQDDPDFDPLAFQVQQNTEYNKYFKDIYNNEQNDDKKIRNRI
jgi:hypothetical protein